MTCPICNYEEARIRRVTTTGSPWRSLKDEPPGDAKYIIARGTALWSYPYDTFSRGTYRYVDRFSSAPVIAELLEFGFTEYMEVPE